NFAAQAGVVATMLVSNVTRRPAIVARRQPNTVMKYDKPTPSLSGAYGVSCRARAERACATPRMLRRFAPRARICRAQQLGYPAPYRRAIRTRLGVLARQHTGFCKHDETFKAISDAISGSCLAGQLKSSAKLGRMSDDYTPRQVAERLQQAGDVQLID